MTNLKKLVLSALVATTTIFSGVEAKAETGGTRLIQALLDNNVPVNVVECDTDDFYGVYKFYTGGRVHGSEIDICTNVATTEAERWETLRHEAVHAAQHCRHDSFDTVMTNEYLKNNISYEDFNFVKANYDESDWLYEWEAFTLQKLSNDFVASLVESNCAHR